MATPTLNCVRAFSILVINRRSSLYCADPAVYPFNLDMIYPEKPQSKLEAILVKLPAHYPVLDFCQFPFSPHRQPC